MKSVLTLIIGLLMVCNVKAQRSIKVHIKGIENTNGNIEIGLYNKKEGFTEYTKRFKGISVKASKSGVIFTFKSLPSGTYAIAVFHDENNNKKIDKNWLGIPSEAYGFSLNKYGFFGPPDFWDVSFSLTSKRSKTLTITLK